MKPVLASVVQDWIVKEGFAPEWSLVMVSPQKDFAIEGFAPIEMAGESDVSFWVGDNFKSATNVPGFSDAVLSRVKAGILFVPVSLNAGSDAAAGLNVLHSRLPGVRYLVPVENPYHVMVEFLNRFAMEPVPSAAVIPASAKVHPTAVVEGELGENCTVGPHCTVMAGAKLGPGCVLESGVTIYPHVRVGANCVFQAGAVLGSRGFGFYEYQGKRRPVPHLAGVRIGDRCSFGANTVVAAGFLAPTTIGNDSHFDSMVQVAHNCKVGDNVYMASQSALAGSVTVGNNVEFAGASKVADHLTIGNNVRVAAKAGVTKSVSDGHTVSGFPAVDIDLWRRCMVRLRQLGKK